MDEAWRHRSAAESVQARYAGVWTRLAPIHQGEGTKIRQAVYAEVCRAYRMVICVPERRGGAATGESRVYIARSMTQDLRRQLQDIYGNERSLSLTLDSHIPFTIILPNTAEPFELPLMLYKFSRPAHLLNLGAATEDDIVQPTSSAFSASRFTPSSQVVITEKIDGANLGISLDSSGRILIQNRAHWVNSNTHFQFNELGIWAEKHRAKPWHEYSV